MHGARAAPSWKDSHGLRDRSHLPRCRQPPHGAARLPARPRRGGVSRPDAPARCVLGHRRGGRRRHRLAGTHLPPAPRRGLPGRRAADHDPQELLRHRQLRARPPRPGARPARLRLPARVQHVQLDTPGRGRARRRRRPRLRDGRCPQPRHGRVLLGRPAVAAGRLRGADGPRARRGPGQPGDRAGVQGVDDRQPVPTRPLAQPHRPRPGVGAGRRGADPDRVARRRQRAAAVTQVLRERPASRSPTSTAAPRTSAPSTTWRSR